MTTVDFFLVLAPTLVAVSYYLSLRRELGPPADERSWTGTGLDATRVAPRIRRVRADYVTEARTHAGHACHRRVALAAARQALAQRSFFQHSRVEVPDTVHDRART